MKKKVKKKDMLFQADELIYQFVSLLHNEKFKHKKSPLPKFTLKEALFIRDLIFLKPKALVFFYVADYFMNETNFKDLPMFNTASIRKLSFFCNFLGSKGNATQAAIKAGYSPKTAKQQGYRILKEIQKHCRG